MKWTYENKLLAMLVGVIIVSGLLFGTNFISVKNLQVLMHQIPEYGLLSIALMITLIISGVNLSVVSMATLSGILGGIAMEAMGDKGPATVIVGVGVMLLIGMITGLINGFIVSYLEVSPIIATLGTMLFYQGLALNITKGGAITAFPKGFTDFGSSQLMGIPLPMWVFVVASICVWFLLSRNEFGKQLYRIGLNATVAKFSGINVKSMVVKSYALSGLLTGLTAIIMTARYNSIRVDYGASYLVYAIVIVILGGVRLHGGRGSLKGVLVALIILSVVIRGLNIANVDTNIIEIVIGLVLLLNLGMNKKR